MLLAVVLWTVRADVRPLVATALLGYGAVIASFWGGVHWGIAAQLPQQSAALHYLWGVTPSLLGWAALPLPASVGLAKLVRRVWLTLEGSAPSKGAVVSVVHDKFVQVGGVTWPTHFYETVVKPFAGLPAHDFSLSGIDLNRGLSKADFAGGVFSPLAQRPAAALPSAK